MNISLNDLVVKDYVSIWIVLSFLLSAIVSYSSYPIIIKISRLKELMQEPGTRSSHDVKTSNLGGIGIFLGIVSVLTFVGSILSYNNLLCFIGSIVVLFFTGIKDDLIELSPIKKLIGQLLATLCVIIISDVRIHSFYGILGIELLPYIFSVIFTLFVFILLINAFNLIDGVDGLAGSIGITCSSLFGFYFYLNGNDSMLFISASLIGSLLTFLFFNFSKTKKIFMGDTGSMVVGFILAYQAISFLRIDHNADVFSTILNPPTLVIAIFSFPLMDTLRVFIIRIINKRSPFSADRNHIHHNLLSLGFKHWEVSIIASFFTIIMAIITYNAGSMNLHLSLLYLILIGFIFSVTPYCIIQLRHTIKNIKVFEYLKKKPKRSLKIQHRYTSIQNIIISIIIYFNT